jgi:hypothetical protein
LYGGSVQVFPEVCASAGAATAATAQSTIAASAGRIIPNPVMSPRAISNLK